MEYRTMRRKHPAWRLLAADHAPLVVSFLHHRFITPNRRTWPRDELASFLEDHLYHLREQLGEDAFPKTAAQYLDEWASDERAWLRKYYPPNTDEPHYDLTPTTERAIDWLASLVQRQFVGTESRLMAVFELLRQLAEGAEIDPEMRIAELEKRRAQIDADIQRIREGRLFLMDSTQVKDRFLLMADTARGLLSDFRQVEENFRGLDRAVRERIAGWDQGKGALLQEIFGARDAIADSDEGKSFRAFWDFLMSPTRQEELTALLATAFSLEPVQELAPDPRLRRIHYDWLEAGEIAQRSVARLSEQLRRYLDDLAWMENRRIMQLVREVEQHALAIRDQPPEAGLMTVDEPAPRIDLAMDRPLYSPPFKARLDSRLPTEEAVDIPADALFHQVHVDKGRLTAHIRRALQTRQQVSLAEVVRAHPIQQGLAELVAYLSIAAEDRAAVIDDAGSQTLTWSDDEGTLRQATMPLVIFNQRLRDVAVL
jgi:Protein of unknown function (DUF3375)